MTQWNDMCPARLRNWANAIERRADFKDATDPYVLSGLAAAWEAERYALYNLLAVIHHDGGHYTGEHGVAKSAADAQQVVHADRAALERARALLAELEWCGVDAWLACPWCLGYQDAHPGERHGHAADCKLAAFLATGSGGAAQENK